MLILHLTKSEKNKQKTNKMHKCWFTDTILSQIVKVIDI